MRVFLGWDDREPEVCRVAAASLKRTSGITPEWLRIDRLRDAGLMWRLADRRGGVWDLVSNAACSTDFAISRFLVPIICQEGWVLFADPDVVFMRDVSDLREMADDRYAVMVVKHEHDPQRGVKMDGRPQVPYARKNWSSVIWWNCAHKANRRLTLHDVNTRTGLALHQFYWLHDDEIGELAPAWNWLVNEQPRPSDLAIAHFTNGCPGLPNWTPQSNDDIWLRAKESA